MWASRLFRLYSDAIGQITAAAGPAAPQRIKVPLGWIYDFRACLHADKNRRANFLSWADVCP
jgi:hypothetical protein